MFCRFEFSLVTLLLLGFILEIHSKCAMKNSLKAAKRDPYLCTNRFLESGPLLPDPENCQCYFHCTYQQEPCYMCCSDGQVFNPDQKRCLPGSAYRCIDQPARYKCPGNGFYVNDKHCRKYWNCNNRDQLPIEEACTENHHWDDEQKVCRNDNEVISFEHEIKPNCVKE